MSEKFVVGDRVQKVDFEARFVFDGTIESITPPKRPRPNDYWKYSQAEQEEMVTHCSVKWDDGTLEENLDMDDLEKQDSETERAFRRTFFATQDLIEEKLSEASRLVAEAVKISEQSGVPFRTDVSHLRNAYFPHSRLEKFPDLDSEFISAVTEAYSDYDDKTGWRHSAVC